MRLLALCSGVTGGTMHRPWAQVKHAAWITLCQSRPATWRAKFRAWSICLLVRCRRFSMSASTRVSLSFMSASCSSSGGSLRLGLTSSSQDLCLPVVDMQLAAAAEAASAVSEQQQPGGMSFVLRQ